MVKQACDQCHQRRTKCDGVKPTLCTRCKQADLNCTYNRPGLKKGPSGTVLSQLRAQPPRLPSVHQLELHNPHHNQVLSAQHRPPTDPASHGLRPLRNLSSEASTSNHSYGDSGPRIKYATLAEATGMDEWESGRVSAFEAGTAHWPTDAPSVGVDAWASIWAGTRFPTFSTNPSGVQTNNLNSSTAAAGPPSLVTSPANHLTNSPRETSSQSNVPVAPLTSPTPSLPFLALVTDSVLRPQIEVFFERVQPIMPIFTKAYIYNRLQAGHHLENVHFGALLLAVSSLALVQPCTASEENQGPERRAKAVMLLDEASKIRSGALFGQEVTLDSVLTSFFMFATLFGLGQQSAAWLRLREAVTLGESMELHRPQAYEEVENEEKTMRLRTFWILAVTERAYAMQRNHSITFKGRPCDTMRLLGLPLLAGEENNPEAILRLQRLTHLFDFIDESILTCWNGNCSKATCEALHPEQIARLQEGLAAREAGLKEFGYEDRGSAQNADLVMTQKWLQNRIWSLSVTHGIATESSPHEALRPTFAFSIARDAIAICHYFRMDALEANGIGLAEKLHDIALTVILAMHVSTQFDVQSWKANSTSQSAYQLLNELIAIMSAFRGGHHPFLHPLLGAIAFAFPGGVHSPESQTSYSGALSVA